MVRPESVWDPRGTRLGSPGPGSLGLERARSCWLGQGPGSLHPLQFPSTFRTRVTLCRLKALLREKRPSPLALNYLREGSSRKSANSSVQKDQLLVDLGVKVTWEGFGILEGQDVMNRKGF